MFPKSFEPVSVVMDGSLQRGWCEPPIATFDTPEIPVQAVGLHYGQIAFEGLRARVVDGRAEVFRADLHWERLCRSMARLAMPPIERPMFERALADLLVQITPDDANADEFLYVRPLVVALDSDWSMSGSQTFRLHVRAGWTREAFSRTPSVVALIEAQHRRTWPGGTGDVKIPANYGPAFASQHRARDAGAHTVLWLDPQSRHVEEFTSMNALLVDDGGVLRAPAPSSTVLDGVTRRSIVDLAATAGIPVDEAPLRWPDPERGEDGPRGALLATGTAAGMSIVDEVREQPAGGGVHTWRSSSGHEHLVQLRELLDSCFWGDARPEWWSSTDQLRW